LGSDFAEALLRGMAPDGGLYMPEAWPRLSPDAWAAGRGYAGIVTQAMAPFIGDALPAGALDRALARLTAGFAPAEVTPLRRLEDGLYMLELFHGPTAAFKDLAMQLAAALSSEALAASGERLTLVTATSGDTGAAAVAAFANTDRVRLIVLHPHERVSAVQRRQMTTVEAPNVLNLAVRGDFDDCQRLVKGLLADESLRDGGRFSSVNSINWARLAGQIPYYLSAVSQLAAMGRGEPERCLGPRHQRRRLCAQGRRRDRFGEHGRPGAVELRAAGVRVLGARCGPDPQPVRDLCPCGGGGAAAGAARRYPR
jgi:threonine synthase